MVSESADRLPRSGRVDTRAVILATDRGMRLRPLTDAPPKPLMAVNGSSNLKRAGFAADRATSFSEREVRRKVATCLDSLQLIDVTEGA